MDRKPYFPALVPHSIVQVTGSGTDNGAVHWMTGAISGEDNEVCVVASLVKTTYGSVSYAFSRSGCFRFRIDQLTLPTHPAVLLLVCLPC